MEQRHGGVPDVVGRELEHHGHPVARGEEPALRAAHGLRSGRRPGGEEQRPQGVDRQARCDAPACGLPRSGAYRAVVERSDKHLPRGGGIVAVGEAIRDEDAPGKIEALERRVELLLVAWFGDHELQVRVRDVACEMLAVPGVVQPGDGDACQPGTAQRKDIVGRVVEEDADVRRDGRARGESANSAASAPLRRAARRGSRRGSRSEGPDDRRSARRCRCAAARTRRPEPAAAPRPGGGAKVAASLRAGPMAAAYRAAGRPLRGDVPLKLRSRPSMAVRNSRERRTTGRIDGEPRHGPREAS